MQNAAASWLMTTLDPDPFTVSLVQVATSLPMFVFAIAAGALADIVDRRRLLIVIQVTVILLVAAFGVLVRFGWVTPNLLLAFAFLVATAAALIMPAWQSIVPLLVPEQHLQPAVALNSIGLNVSRAVGPALSEIIIGAWGLAAPFWVNALATVGVIWALVWWRPPDVDRDLPREQFRSAIRVGFRHARFNPHLRATLIRAAGFLPVRQRLLGAAAARRAQPGCWRSLALRRSARRHRRGGGRRRLYLACAEAPSRRGPLVAAGTLGTVVALLLFAFVRQPAAALAASVIAGASWIAVLATVNVSAQVALPDWVRGRGLSIFGTVMFGSLTLGSAVWGKVAALTSLPVAHLIAAAGALIAVPLLWRWKLQTGAELDLTPSMSWPQPVLSRGIEARDGPVLVTVEYQIRPEDRALFFAAIAKLSYERRRDGAFEWGLFEDLSQGGQFVESFKLESWVEHLRQHERVTRSDRQEQELVNRFQIDGAPKVTHLIAAS